MSFVKEIKKIAKHVNPKMLTQAGIALLITVVTISSILYLMSLFGITTDKIKIFAESFGALSVGVLILLMMLSVMSPLPDTPVAVASIIIYGPIGGFFIAYIGTVLGAISNFVIVRRLGRKFFERKFPNLVEYSNKFAKNFGFEAIVFLRIFPSVTFDIAAYAAALTKVKFRIFVYATMIGAIVPAFNYVLIGIGFSSGNPYELALTLLSSFIFIGLMRVFFKYFFKGKLDLLEEEAQEIE